MNKIGIFVFLFFLMIGCRAKYEDMSHDVKYSHLIGHKYVLTKKLLIYGITLDANYKKQIDIYTIHRPPGIGGPEVLTGNYLLPGTKMEIKKVVKCINCLPPSVKFEIEILFEETFQDHPILLSEPVIQLEYKNGKAGINSDFFDGI